MSTEFHAPAPLPAAAAAADAAATDAKAPDAGHAPTEPVSRGWITLFGLVWFGF
ncbi:hypothetical protein [Streptomyces sp. NBC_00878]|uniref:hypothetical protein n=1 Tax=Streptomyces sp. NBC_00878 TaxID=2975854 RepID=UPI002251B568|nr:hypothetical protein [Streptomyces sp. NBC_00878]MCX4907195.1 hypothetical protein [Streptomyces sp. NBC_00878]